VLFIVRAAPTSHTITNPSSVTSVLSSIVTGYELNDRWVGVRVLVGSRSLVQTGSEVHPASYLMGTGVKRPGREAGHSPKTSAEVKRMWTYTSIPPYVFME
jgi:hypothetical protein